MGKKSKQKIKQKSKPKQKPIKETAKSETPSASVIPVLNNFVPEKPVRNFRPKINLDACTNSYNCIVYCPHDAIDKNDKNRPVIDYDLCTGCLVCLRECPTNAVSDDREMK